MRSWVLAAGLLAAMALVPTGATAADVGDDDDRDALSDPRGATSPPGYYDQDDDDDDDRPSPGKRYSGPPPYYGPPGKYSGTQCARSEQVRRRLADTGWQDFHDGRQRGDMVVMKARRAGGRLYELTLHRCSGQLVEVRPLEGRPFGPYAFNRQYRYDNPYGFDDRRWPDRPYAHGGPRRWWWHGD